LIDEKLRSLQKFLKNKNAVYSTDYDKVRAQIKVLEQLKSRIRG